MGIRSLNPRMITLARESRGFDQKKLASELGLTQGTLSKIENHLILIKPKTLRKLVRVLKYPENFFMQPGGSLPSILSYRKNDRVAAPIITQLDAAINIRRMALQQMIHSLGISKASIPLISVSSKKTPQVIANEVRKAWSIPAGPISNLTEILEQNGVILLRLNFETENLLSRTILTEDHRPIIIFNSKIAGDQQRFTLAHELGHLIMHAFIEVNSNRDVKHESNLFAAEFLMPRLDIIKDLKTVSITMARLGELKRKWGVSMQALLYRCNDLAIISDNQKKFILTQFAKAGIKKREPQEFDIKPELPTLLNNILNSFQQSEKLSDQAFYKRLGLSRTDFQHPS